MRDITSHNFGLLIAYVLPGCVTLWGVSHTSPIVAAWLGAADAGPTVGGFLYVTLASVGAGLTVSTVRWLVIDTLHARTGLRQPDWNLTRLADSTAAFGILIEIHYRYYQAYANTLVALPTAFVLRWSTHGYSAVECAAVAALSSLFFVASRDTLRKYYDRVEEMLGRPRRRGRRLGSTNPDPTEEL